MEKKNRIVFGGITFATSFLFYMQAIEYNGMYYSDLPDHIKISTEEISYSFLYLIIRIIFLLFSKYAYVILAVFEGLAVAGTWYYAKRYIQNNCNLSDSRASIVSVILLSFTSIHLPSISNSYYMGLLVTQPWHNITYIFMRCFAVMTIYYFRDIYVQFFRNEEIKLKDIAFVSGLLLLTTCIKPNFYMFFAIVICVNVGVLLVKKRVRFRNCLYMFLALIPAGLAILIQGLILYINPSDEKSGIAIGLSYFFFFGGAKGLLLKVFGGFLLLLVIFVLKRDALQPMDFFYVEMLLCALLEAMLFSETGPREMHGNFMWGVYVAAYMIYLNELPFLFSEKSKSGVSILGKALLFWHVVSAICYLCILFSGGAYW